MRPFDLNRPKPGRAAHRPRLTVDDRLAALDRTDPPGLRAALTAIPGAPLELPTAAWALKLGPDRAWSLAAVVDEFGIALDAPDRDRLHALIAQRNRAMPVLELVRRGATSWLSLLDDWDSAAASALRSAPEACAQAVARRTEIPLNPQTAPAIGRWTTTFLLRLSPPADAELQRNLALAAAPPPDRFSTRNHRAPSATLDASGGHLLLDAAGNNHLAVAFARLPRARSWRRDGPSWLVPPTPETAYHLRQITDSDDSLAIDDAVARWLDRSPKWAAHATITTAYETPPMLSIATQWGIPPATLDEIPDHVHDAGVLSAPLSVGALRVVDRIAGEQPELRMSRAMARATTWSRTAGDTKRVPGGMIDVVAEGDGARLAVEALWDADAEAVFAREELRQLREWRTRYPSATVLPVDAWAPETLALLIRSIGLELTPAAETAVSAKLAEVRDADRLRELSRAANANVHVPGLARELLPFQRAGIAYALERRRVLIADEQGLGKTVQALATAEADAAFPAVVICPASLKLNWLREARDWLPHRVAVAVDGRRATDLAHAVIIVLNYDVVDAHLPALRAVGPRALILDESHYVKNPDAQRTAAVLALLDALTPEALRLALTGTPVINRPAELATQLRVLGRLHEYGSARSFDRDYATDRSRQALHDRLRSSCYVRRRKEDVLDQLPAKRRAVVTLPLDNAIEYRDAEQDFVSWLRAQIAATGAAQLPESSRVAAIVRLTALRRLAATGKLAAAVDWIADFCESQERLVVFAHHRNVQRAIVDRFPDSARILGRDSVAQRQASVEAFQSDDGPKLCVCSLEAASHGFTLTAAAHVAFLELAWTPAKHDQAEDRLHRIGQRRAVTAWYLLAAETIDERIAELLEDKRSLMHSLTDGGVVSSDSLITALLQTYASS